MLRRVLLLSLAAAAAAARTSETVQRVVMVRTTGSDLQPAATGFIYKKETDGREIVEPMRESEIERHLAELYTDPVGSGPVGSAERVIPVSEHRDEPLDGLEHVDYEAILHDYGANRDYLDTLKRFEANLRRDHRGPRRKYANFESYSVTDDHETRDDAHKPYHHYSKHGGAKDGFREIYDTHKDDEYFGKVHAFPDHEHYGGRGHKYGADTTEHDSQHGDTGRQGSAEQQRAQHSSEERHAPEHSAADAGTNGQAAGTDGRTDGKSYGYEIKH